MNEIAIVRVSFGTPDEAALVARTLVEERLVACATIAGGTSVYRWQDVVEESDETIVIFKTSLDAAPGAAARIAALHSYDLPVIERWAATVDDAVFEWVTASVS